MIQPFILLADIAVDLDATVVIQFGIYVVTMFGLYFLFGKRFLEVREARFAGTKGSEREAAEFEERAESILLEYEALLKKARQDAVEVRDALAGEGKEESEELVAETQAEIDAQLTTAREELQKAIETSREGINKRAEELSDVLVKKVLHV